MPPPTFCFPPLAHPPASTASVPVFAAAVAAAAARSVGDVRDAARSKGVKLSAARCAHLKKRKGKNVRGEGGEGGSRGSKGARREPPPFLGGSRMAAEGREVTAGAAAVLARRKDRPPLPRRLREAANEETSDEE